MAVKIIAKKYRDISDIAYMYDAGDFEPDKQEQKKLLLPEGYIFDEDMSIKWNRQMVEKHNKKVKETIKNHQNAKGKLIRNMRDMVRDFISGCYKIDITIAEKIEKFAWEMYSDNISEDYFYYADKLAEFCNDTFNN